MAKKGNSTAPAIAREKEPAKVNLHLPKEAKVKVDGFNSVGVNDKVRLVVTGTVKEISDSAEEWSPGKRMTIHVSGCKITGPEKKVSMDEALKASAMRM